MRDERTAKEALTRLSGARSPGPVQAHRADFVDALEQLHHLVEQAAEAANGEGLKIVVRQDLQ